MPKTQLLSFYCSHMLTARQHLRINPQQYVSEWFSLMTYMRTWDASFRHIPNPEYWPTLKGTNLVIGPGNETNHERETSEYSLT